MQPSLLWNAPQILQGEAILNCWRSPLVHHDLKTHRRASMPSLEGSRWMTAAAMAATAAKLVGVGSIRVQRPDRNCASIRLKACMTPKGHEPVARQPSCKACSVDSTEASAGEKTAQIRLPNSEQPPFQAYVGSTLFDALRTEGALQEDPARPFCGQGACYHCEVEIDDGQERRWERSCCCKVPPQGVDVYLEDDAGAWGETVLFV